jgi:CheY-like chemotaxis protein
MKKRHRGFTILLADSDPDEYDLLRDALAENGFTGELEYVSDAAELMERLRGDRDEPSLIIMELDLRGGEEGRALADLKADPELSHIPVVVMSTLSDPEHVARSYGLGARSHIDKPLTMSEQVRVVGVLLSYWMEAVVVPRPAPRPPGADRTGAPPLPGDKAPAQRVPF